MRGGATMFLIDEFLSLFLESSDIQIDERSFIFELEFKAKLSSKPLHEDIKKILEKFPARDKVKVIYTDETDDVLSIDRDIIIPNNEFGIGLDGDSNIKVQLYIQKKVVYGHFSIYKWENFCQCMLDKTIMDLLKFYDAVLTDNPVVYFDLYDSDILFCTNTMFYKRYDHQDTLGRYNRIENIKNCKKASCFYNFAEINLLPDDFNLIIDCSENSLFPIFEKLKTILSLVYISDSALIEDNILKMQISGNRIIDYEMDLSVKDSVCNENLFNIYDWIYTDGNPVDKAMIARNIISLHCRYTDLLNMDGKTFLSIQSNFKIYQRANVQQYIEVKNQLASYILRISESVSEIIIGLSGSLRNNFMAVFSFLFTVVLVNISSNTPLDNIFTKDITCLVELILAGSIGYLIISVKDMDYKLKKMEEGFEAIKKNYSELLDEQDIIEIFSNSNVIKNSIQEAQGKKDKYIRLWLALIILGFITIEYISVQPFLTGIIKDLFNVANEMLKRF